ncbi:MAG: tRNA pseudouridine(38-40) synthase TruA [Anaerolineales bacterium]|nr:tRNA pseudouridine(38-40) synthase TruA [Anaerolineales bacterium]TET96322.1 MAG: tRNA pseudouridine(38-40) synthase TruA [Anaerolineales bacterium]
MKPAVTEQEETLSLATYKSIVAYDGTNYEGFQRQASGRRTVQGELEQALQNIGWQESSLRAAGRTDSGVHARGQVIAYQLAWKHPPEDLTMAINANLPYDVAVRKTLLAQKDFHPRHSAVSRRYRYRLFIDKTRDPLRERYAWRISAEADMQLLNRAADMIVGRQDFGAFGSAPRPEGSTVREIFESVWDRQDDELWFEIEANAFLYHMVRRLVSALLAIGFGKMEMDELIAAVQNPNQKWDGGLAPSQGLCLLSVKYE